ncbi:MAG: RecQ family ATP-dependent DNA helicase [Desulfobacula sp.]|nr:RecQ family ATP-dependent DNA helicase [Desulfobacula sp.]
MKTFALDLLRKSLQNDKAEFRDKQWESIEGLIKNERMLVVQRTGWGKSMVYFLATRLLRKKGAGPALLISPLLSLMRNQIEAAERIGVKAVTINSTNTDDWDRIEQELLQNSIDVLIISPERLANDKFRDNVMSSIAERVGLFVVDEAHCISDWGHDFRPDYRRIIRVLNAIPSNVPVLATTATANDRVVNDIVSQLGIDIKTIRGALVRDSLKLQNINMPSPAARMAWLAETIPDIEGSGIIYTLTIRDAERVAEWLRINGINAESYHSQITNSANGASAKEILEQKLLKNEIKALVATIALGMGFDKPDLGFVIHFQRPASVVHYYQQVGRAGRAVDEAYGILLCGEEDDHIADFFIRNAFPPQKDVTALLNALEESDIGLSIKELQVKLNLSESRIKEKIVKYLTVESPSPITKIGSKWQATAAAIGYEIDKASVEAITQIRRQEQTQMQEYMNHSGCLMKFLEKALDDPNPTLCKKCVNCNRDMLLPEECDIDLVNRAAIYLKRSYQPIEPRKQWPAFKQLPTYGFSGNIKQEMRAEEGRSLCLWRDAGWGDLVRKGKYDDEQFSDDLVTACKEMIKKWAPEQAPEWVTCIPSEKHPELVPDFAQRLANVLGIPFVPCIEKVKDNQQQKLMENSLQQARNLDSVFKVKLEYKSYSPCFLVDDIVSSRWTLTVAAALLREVGCQAVYPMALALNSPRMD